MLRYLRCLDADIFFTRWVPVLHQLYQLRLYMVVNNFSMMPLMLRNSDNIQTSNFIIQMFSGQTSVMSFSELIACFFIYIVIDSSNNNTCRPRLFPGFSSKV